MSERYFPVLHGYGSQSVPWSMVAPCERQALTNHSQTLERLAERGGLSPAELLAVLDGLRWRDLPQQFRGHNADSARVELARRVDEWNATTRTDEIARLTRERDEARADVARFHNALNDEAVIGLLTRYRNIDAVAALLASLQRPQDLP